MKYVIHILIISSLFISWMSNTNQRPEIFNIHLLNEYDNSYMSIPYWGTYKKALPADSEEIHKADGKTNEFQSQKLKEYNINISATDLGEKKVKIDIGTNFPNGTNLRLFVGRSYNVKGNNEIYSGDLFEKDFSITNGKFEIIITVNDAGWYNKYQELVRDLPNDFTPISKISDNITIDVLYTAATPQPTTVQSILGKRGEFVSGKGVEHFGTGTAGRLTTLRVSKELYSPRTGSTKKQPEYANYQSLKLNTTYSISKETPLMPEFEPSDPLAALNQIKYLQAGCRIRILSIKTKYNSPWYEVQATNKLGENIGKGWINCTALIGQDILIIK